MSCKYAFNCAWYSKNKCLDLDEESLGIMCDRYYELEWDWISSESERVERESSRLVKIAEGKHCNS